MAWCQAWGSLHKRGQELPSPPGEAPSRHLLPAPCVCVCVCVCEHVCVRVGVCMGVCTTTTIIVPHTRAHAHSHTQTHPHKETHINTRTSAGSVAVIIGKTSFDRIHTSPFVVLRDSSTCPGSRAISAYCTPVVSADESMNTGVGQGRQTPPTQVLGVMGCAVVGGGGGKGGGATISGRACALMA